MARNACGSDDHPDPALFLQIFRLLSAYALTKPPRGGNVTGSELLSTLMSTSESMAFQKLKQSDWNDKLDAIISKGKLQEINENEKKVSQTLFILDNKTDEHSYDVVTSSNESQAHIAGYIAKKILSFTQCINCISSCKSNKPSENDTFTKLINEGSLTYPSHSLYQLTMKMESVFLSIASSKSLKYNLLHLCLDRLINIADELPFVGCEKHYKVLTRKVINFFIIVWHGPGTKLSVNRLFI